MGCGVGTERWSDHHPFAARLLGIVIGAGLAGGFAVGLVMLSGPAPKPEAVAVMPTRPPPDPDQVRNAEHCEKAADALAELAEAVRTAGTLRDESLLAVLDRAEDRMARRADVPSERLTHTFSELAASLREFRRAIETGAGVQAAVTQTRELIATLDKQCYDLLVNDVGS